MPVDIVKYKYKHKRLVLKMYESSSHCVFKLAVHLVFCTKYRRKLLSRQDIKTALEQEFNGIAAELGVEIVKSHIADTHVHLLVSYPPTLAITEIVAKLKTYSSLNVRKRFPELKKSSSNQNNRSALWSRGYFASSVGANTSKTVERYIADHVNKIQD